MFSPLIGVSLSKPVVEEVLSVVAVEHLHASSVSAVEHFNLRAQDVIMIRLHQILMDFDLLRLIHGVMLPSLKWLNPNMVSTSSPWHRYRSMLLLESAILDYTHSTTFISHWRNSFIRWQFGP